MARKDRKSAEPKEGGYPPRKMPPLERVATRGPVAPRGAPRRKKGADGRRENLAPRDSARVVAPRRHSAEKRESRSSCLCCPSLRASAPLVVARHFRRFCFDFLLLDVTSQLLQQMAELQLFFQVSAEGCNTDI